MFPGAVGVRMQDPRGEGPKREQTRSTVEEEEMRQWEWRDAQQREPGEVGQRKELNGEAQEGERQEEEVIWVNRVKASIESAKKVHSTPQANTKLLGLPEAVPKAPPVDLGVANDPPRDLVSTFDSIKATLGRTNASLSEGWMHQMRLGGHQPNLEVASDSGVHLGSTDAPSLPGLGNMAVGEHHTTSTPHLRTEIPSKTHVPKQCFQVFSQAKEDEVKEKELVSKAEEEEDLFSSKPTVEMVKEDVWDPKHLQDADGMKLALRHIASLWTALMQGGGGTVDGVLYTRVQCGNLAIRYAQPLTSKRP